MVLDVILTRQPVEGRSRDGGLRFGEMERDCILSHGASQFLKETLQDRSDNYRMYTCKKCGLVSSVNKKAKINYCKNCDNSTSFSEVRVPYAMKLFIQELKLCVSLLDLTPKNIKYENKIILILFLIIRWIFCFTFVFFCNLYPLCDPGSLSTLDVSLACSKDSSSSFSYLELFCFE